MPANRKPRKAHRPRPVITPLNMRDGWKIEGAAIAALLTLKAGPADEAGLATLVAHADMVRRMHEPSTPERRQADTVIRVIAEIKARPECVVFPLEEVAIRAAMKVTLPAIRNASNAEIYRVAMASLRDMDRNGCVRVVL